MPSKTPLPQPPTGGDVVIEYPGTPQGKERPKFGRGRVYTPQKTRQYEVGLGWAAKVAMKGRPLIHGPVRVSVVALFTPTKTNKGRYRLGKPDSDNLFKAIADGLNRAVYLDDSQIVSHTIEKLNDLDGLGEGITVVIKEL